MNADLTAKEIVGILAEDDPNVVDAGGAINLEIEVRTIPLVHGD